MADIRRIEDETQAELKKVYSTYAVLSFFSRINFINFFSKIKEIVKGEIKGYAAEGDVE